MLDNASYARIYSVYVILNNWSILFSEEETRKEILEKLLASMSVIGSK